ncbi:MAG: penicillin-binding protein 1C, partial [Thermoleophilia bacterium]|nr:penicillin-binding protein 1C [Thermoleophilia bacterium]
MQRTLRIAALAAGVALLGGAGGVAAWIASLGSMPLGEELEFSTQVIDREGRLLRPYATADGRWRLPTNVASVDPR